MPDSRRLDDDLFITRKNQFGEWQEPVSLGLTINSGEHDFAPFWRNPYLYFSSDRTGNADLYRSKRLDHSWQNWSAPEPLAGLNTAGFEAYFSIHPKDSTVYYVQALPDSVHSDLVTASLKNLFNKPDSPDSVLVTQQSLAKNQSITIRTSHLFFDYRSSELSSESQEVLLRLLQHIRQEKPSRIRILGYADAVGESEPNLLLSQKRAVRVKLFLMQEGKVNIPIELESLGSSKAQVNSSRPEADRQKDRRVEIILIQVTDHEKPARQCLTDSVRPLPAQFQTQPLPPDGNQSVQSCGHPAPPTSGISDDWAVSRPDPAACIVACVPRQAATQSPLRRRVEHYADFWNIRHRFARNSRH
ncbi:Outer membrane protein, bacterial [Corchorus olitorius]|uniref:Outer membrane protein, bacterial n=1 Tax=Corchorus olitorius TaxID=93759 RepID=A0A1R3L329_9ROSI|nr:Outer membrane protein, bacterial [Corchorus olitorius]